MRTFVVGDIHGCMEELDRLLDALAPAADDHLCFLGDYIDRGPASQAVIDRLIRLRAEGPRCTFLKGNHEDMFLAYLGLPGRYGDAFISNGGQATLASYGLDPWVGPAAMEHLPPEHLQFLTGLETVVQHGRFTCVHAGVRASRPLDNQAEEDLLWIRDDFIDQPHPFPTTILFGHTPQRDVLLDLPFKIGLDTGLVYGNRLSCLGLDDGSLWQIARHATVVSRRSIASALRTAGISLP